MNQCIPKESDLQSDAFDRSATSAVEPKERFELSTYCLQNSCSDQLSYFGSEQRKFNILVKYSQQTPQSERDRRALRNEGGVPQLKPKDLSDFGIPCSCCGATNLYVQLGPYILQYFELGIKIFKSLVRLKSVLRYC